MFLIFQKLNTSFRRAIDILAAIGRLLSRIIIKQLAMHTTQRAFSKISSHPFFDIFIFCMFQWLANLLDYMVSQNMKHFYFAVKDQ
jgi:hypothetical protein